jgi:hypothetical protein
MTLDLAADQDVFFADFAESGQVTPPGGSARDVSLLIYRQQPAVQPDGGARVRSYHIGIKTSATEGLTADEALQEADGDVPTVTFPESVGDASGSHITRPINRVLRQNAGLLLVEVLL